MLCTFAQGRLEVGVMVVFDQDIVERFGGQLLKFHPPIAGQ
jgi:hypothetical protein